MTRYGAILLVGLTVFGCGNSGEATGSAPGKPAGGSSDPTASTSSEALVERELQTLSRIAELTERERIKARKIMPTIVRLRQNISARGGTASLAEELGTLRDQAEQALQPVVPNEREPLLHRYVTESQLFSGS